MIRRSLCKVTAAAILPLTLSMGVALAHSQSQRQTVKGIVTNVNKHRLQVQTWTGSVRATFTSTTWIGRRVIGSTSDLRRGETVDVRVVPGTATAQQVTIEPVGGMPRIGPPRHSADDFYGAAGPMATGMLEDRGSHGSEGYYHGQIVLISSNAIVVRGERGQTTPYTLSDATTITKIIRGGMSDLAEGEMVSLCKSKTTGAALWVEVLNS